MEYHQLESGQKGLLVALARELFKLGNDNPLKVKCVVDADYDYLLKRTEENPYLLYTDGTSIEMYSYSEFVVNRIMRFALNCSLNPIEHALKELQPILSDVFAIRATNEKLKLGLTWLSFEGRCVIQSDGSFGFDRKKFIRDYLNKNSAIAKAKEFDKCYEKLQTENLSDYRKHIRGHDFVTLLGRYCRLKAKWSPGKMAADTIMSGFFRLTLDAKRMAEEPLFRQLRSVYEN